MAADPSSQTNSPTRFDVRASLSTLRIEVNSFTFVLKLLVYGIISAGSLLAAAQSLLWLRVLGIIGLGCMFAHAAELQHQALHNLGFRNRRANTVAGIVLGMPMLVSFAAFRAAHLRHHRDLGTPRNREFFDYGDQYGQDQDRSRVAGAATWFMRFSMLYHYRLFVVNLWRALRGADIAGESATTSRRIRRDHYIFLVALAGLTALSLATGSALIVWGWLAPLVLVAAPLHAAIELPEHFRCETLDENPFVNTRTIRSNRLMMWFTNGNNYHVEHHLMPNLPIERLPELHMQIHDKLRYFHPTYVSYFLSLRRR